MVIKLIINTFLSETVESVWKTWLYLDILWCLFCNFSLSLNVVSILVDLGVGNFCNRRKQQRFLMHFHNEMHINQNNKRSECSVILLPMSTAHVIYFFVKPFVSATQRDTSWQQTGSILPEQWNSSSRNNILIWHKGKRNLCYLSFFISLSFHPS